MLFGREVRKSKLTAGTLRPWVGVPRKQGTSSNLGLERMASGSTAGARFFGYSSNDRDDLIFFSTLRILGMSWGVKTTCLEAPGVSLGGSGVSIGGVRSLRVRFSWQSEKLKPTEDGTQFDSPAMILDGNGVRKKTGR